LRLLTFANRDRTTIHSRAAAGGYRNGCATLGGSPSMPRRSGRKRQDKAIAPRAQTRLAKCISRPKRAGLIGVNKILRRRRLIGMLGGLTFRAEMQTNATLGATRRNRPIGVCPRSNGSRHCAAFRSAGKAKRAFLTHINACRACCERSCSYTRIPLRMRRRNDSAACWLGRVFNRATLAEREDLDAKTIECRSSSLHRDPGEGRTCATRRVPRQCAGG
jgi:hypothetical protein